MAYNNVTEVTNSDQISTTDRSASGPAPDGSPPTGNVPWGSVTDTPTSAAGYGIVNGAELDAFAGLGTTGFVTRTGSNAYATRTLTAGDNVTITNASGVAGNPTISVPSVPWADITGTPTTLAGYGIVDAQPLDSDLTAIAALTTTAYGRSFLTLADAAAARTYIGAGTSSFSGAFADLTGIPTTLAGYGIVDAQPLDGDLTAIAALSSTGYARRTGSNTWTLDSFVPASLGGTGFTSYASGDLLYGNGGGTLSKLAEPGFPGYVLSAVGGVPTWSQLSTLTATTITGTANQVLVNGTSGAAQTGPVTLTLPQSIATSSTPEFARLGVGVPAYSSNQRLVVSSGAVASPPTWFPADIAMVEAGSGNANIQIFSSASTIGALRFSRPALRNAGGLQYDHATDNFLFVTNGAGAASVTPSGFQGALGATTPSTVRANTLQTDAPSGGSSQTWKLGNYTAGAAAQAGKVRVEINGVAYDLLTA